MIEATFEEIREHLSLETTRGRCRNTVLRVEPYLFWLYTLIVYWFDHLGETEKRFTSTEPARRRSLSPTPCQTVRYNAWKKYLFSQAMPRTTVEKITARRKKGILNALALPT